MRPAALALCAMTFTLQGCGFPSGHTSTLTFPSPLYNVDPSQVPAAPVTARPNGLYSANLSGVVKAGGVALAGATVAAVADGFVVLDTRTAVTDSSGRYDIPDVTIRTPIGPLVSVYQPGYFTGAKWAPGFGNQVVDFDLAPLMYTELGPVVRSRMVNARCEGLGYGNVPCHRIAIVAPATGTLEVNVSAPAITGDLDIWGPKGASAAYYPCPCSSPFSMKVPVEKGETYEIRVTMTPEIELTALVRVS